MRPTKVTYKGYQRAGLSTCSFLHKLYKKAHKNDSFLPFGMLLNVFSWMITVSLISPLTAPLKFLRKNILNFAILLNKQSLRRLRHRDCLKGEKNIILYSFSTIPKCLTAFLQHHNRRNLRNLSRSQANSFFDRALYIDIRAD